MRLAENTGRKKSPSEHHCTTLSGYIFATKARIDNRKKNLLNSNISSRRSHNMVNFRPLTAEIGLPVWAFQQILTDFTSWLHYCSNIAHRRPNKLCTMFCRLLHWHTIYIFGGSCPLTEFFLLQSSLYFGPSLAFSYIGSVTARHSSSGVSQTLQRGTRNGITELSWRAPPIFGWAAVTLGIGPHSSSWWS